MPLELTSTNNILSPGTKTSACRALRTGCSHGLPAPETLLKIIDMASNKPVIGVPACRRMLDPHFFHIAGEKYLTALAEAADCIPVVIPALGEAMELEVLLRRLDGLLLPGSPSMVEPHHYEGPPSEPDTLHDPHRDATTLALIPAVVEAGIPVLAICRGFQEMNVAFGGTLHQDLPSTGKYREHQADDALAVEVQYGPAHDLELSEGGLLHQITGRRRLTVNSLHDQGVDQLGRHLAVEAVSDDGVIEGIRVADAPSFALGVQWHPEWQVMDNPDSIAIFRAFGEASRRYEDKQHHA